MIFVYFSIAFNLLPETEAEKVEKKIGHVWRSSIYCTVFSKVKTDVIQAKCMISYLSIFLSIVILFYFVQEHFEVSCPKCPQTCDKCGQENIPRDMVIHFAVRMIFLECLKYLMSKNR